MIYLVIFMAVAMTGLMFRHHIMGFWGQSPDHYHSDTQKLDIRTALDGVLICDGVIYGPFGRVVSRFNAVMTAKWDGNSGVIDETFTYDTQSTQSRQWQLKVQDDGHITMTATDVIGQGRGQQIGDAVQFKYLFQLPKEAGSHTLNARDWIYRTPDGTLMNRSQMRKFGFLALELIAVIRPLQMPNLNGKRYWIIGASEGIGTALAHALSDQGTTVILSARNKEKLNALAAEVPRSTALALDVTDGEAIITAAQSLGNVDGMIYMAGDYTPMSAQEFKIDQAERMIEVNLTGAMRITGALLPDMIRNNQGHLLFIGSLASFRGLPAALGYSTSKAGLVSFAESLAIDLRHTDICIQIGHPGFVKTRLTDKNDFDMPFMQTPDEAALEIIKLMKSNQFSHAFPRFFSWIFRLSVFLPNKLYFRFFSKD